MTKWFLEDNAFAFPSIIGNTDTDGTESFRRTPFLPVNLTGRPPTVNGELPNERSP